MNSYSTPIPIVVGAIFNAKNQVLITQRHQNTHLGSFWEFPGGKVEVDENSWQALKREMLEEVGISIQSGYKKIALTHHYPDRSIHIQLWKITAFDGTPTPKEQQKMIWCNLNQLSEFAFPAANKSLIQSLKLPDYYLIVDEKNCVERVSNAVKNGISLIQLRADQLDFSRYSALVATILPLCHAHQAQLIINRPLDEALDIPADGIHLKSRELMQLSSRPIPNTMLCSAACHNPQELAQAEKIGVDFITLSPVNPTQSHLHATPLGWDIFQQWVDVCNLPVYALGGMQTGDLSTAKEFGAQGLAGITRLSF